jgi:isopenicillin-N N-acyltransferase like protein
VPPLVEVESSDPWERGRQYGEQARVQIATSIAFYTDEFERKSGLTWQEVCEQTPQWVPLIEAAAPGLLDEARGVADGANVRLEEILALNGRGELRKGNPFERPEGCTAFSLTGEATGDGHVYCGQNWDWRVGTKESVVMLRIVQPPKPTIVMQVEAGQIGRHGANSAGIGLNANGLEAPFGFGPALPQPFIRRRILDAPDMATALNVVYTSKPALCTNLILTHRDGFSIDLETTPARHGVMRPESGMLVHANAFLSFVPPQIAGTYRPSSVDSLYRAPRLARALAKARAAQDTAGTRAAIAAGLSDHFSHPDGVCTHPNPRDGNRWETVASAIVDLTTGDYLVADGNPCEHPFEPLPCNLYEGALR